jgi:DNA-binding PadR family transcriptional regulator
MSPVFRHGRLRLYLLKLLDESPRHGYEVIRLLQDRFMGVYAPSPGTIYPRLARLEEEGLVTHDEAGGRKVYRITDKGREELRNRSGDLSELEEEITASVRDIAREVTEDVRETVRNLREELTFAARDMHRRGYAEPPGRARAGSRARSRSAWDVAQQEAEEAGQDRGEAGWGHDEARRERDEARQERHRERDEARRERDEARRERDEARRERDEARRERSGWHGWPPGSGWADPGSYRDLEQLARHFTRELRDAAAAAQAVSEEAVGDLRTILDDALDRIKAEVFSDRSAPRTRRDENSGGPGPDD